MTRQFQEGKVVIFCAPSGAGKTSIVHELLKKELKLSFSISACTREQRKNEKDGVDYYFLSVDEFKKSISNDSFIEWEEVYENQFYGTLKKEIHRIWKANKHVIFDVDVKGGIALKQHFKENALAIFIQPPSIEELQKRLIKRGTDNTNSINKRIEKAKYELSFIKSFDAVIVNNLLSDAVSEAEHHVRNFLSLS